MRKNKGKKYAFGIMAAWCLAVGAAALTGCGAKEADNKITVESASEAPETKRLRLKPRRRRLKHRRQRLQTRMSRSQEWRKTA